MNITVKQNDPIADLKIVDAHFRWALLSIAAAVGETGLDKALKAVGLERFSQVYAADKVEVISNLTFGDYAKVNTGILSVYGEQESRNIIHSGELFTRYAIRQRSEFFKPSIKIDTTSLDLNSKVKGSLETMITGYRDIANRAGHDYTAWVEEDDDRFLYHLETCELCAGTAADEPICMFMSGSLQESLKWFTYQRFEVQEIECRAMGAPACVFEIKKKKMLAL